MRLPFSKNILFMVGLFLLSSAVIFFRYLDIPPHLAFDEVEFAKLALSLGEKPFTLYDAYASGHSTLYFYHLLGAFKLLGVNTVALRIISAICGIIGVLLFYLIIKKASKNASRAFLTALIFLSLRWYFSFARFSFEATFLLTLELTATYFFFLFLEKKRLYQLVLCAIFAGLAFHSYYPGRLFFLLPLSFLFLYARSIKNMLIFCLIVAAISGPLLFAIAPHQDIRINQVSVLLDKTLSIPEKMTQIKDNVVKTLLMFHIKGDMNGRHNFPGKPALNPILGLLFIGGLIVSWKKRTDRYTLFFGAWLLISLIPPLFTYSRENPNMLRVFPAIPAVVYFVGLFLMTIFELKKLPHKKILKSILLILIGISIFYELRTYFLFQSRVTRNSFEIICDLKELVSSRTQYIPERCRVSKNLF